MYSSSSPNEGSQVAMFQLNLLARKIAKQQRSQTFKNKGRQKADEKQLNTWREVTQEPQARLTFSKDDVGVRVYIPCDSFHGKIVSFDTRTRRHSILSGKEDIRKYDLLSEPFLCMRSIQSHLLKTARLDETELPPSGHCVARTESAAAPPLTLVLPAPPPPPPESSFNQQTKTNIEDGFSFHHVQNEALAQTSRGMKWCRIAANELRQDSLIEFMDSLGPVSLEVCLKKCCDKGRVDMLDFLYCSIRNEISDLLSQKHLALLHRAARGGHSEVAVWLINHGLVRNLSHRNVNGETPIHLAYRYGWNSLGNRLFRLREKGRLPPPATRIS